MLEKSKVNQSDKASKKMGLNMRFCPNRNWTAFKFCLHYSETVFDCRKFFIGYKHLFIHHPNFTCCKNMGFIKLCFKVSLIVIRPNQRREQTQDFKRLGKSLICEENPVKLSMIKGILSSFLNT